MRLSTILLHFQEFRDFYPKSALKNANDRGLAWLSFFHILPTKPILIFFKGDNSRARIKKNNKMIYLVFKQKLNKFIFPPFEAKSFNLLEFNVF